MTEYLPMKPDFSREILDAIGMPIFIHDAQDRLLFVNHTYCEAADVTETDALGKLYWKILPLGDGPIYNCTAIQQENNADNYQVELNIGNKCFLAKRYIVRNSQGEILYFLCVLDDISENKKLRDSEERYRRLFETAQDGILLLNANSGMIEEANPFMAEITGYSREMLIGKYIWDLGFLKNIMENKEKFHELQKQDFVRYENLPLETINGKKMHVEFISNIYTVNNIRVIQCNIRDIDRRKLAEDNNIKLNHMYRTISRCNEVLVRATDENELTDKMCRVLNEEGGFPMVWVGYAELDDGKTIQPVAVAGVEINEIVTMNLTWGDGKNFHGPAGSAIRQGQTAVFHDVKNNENLGPERELALTRGNLTVAAIPLKLDNNNILGVLEVYGTLPDELTEDIISLLNELAGDLAFGISNLRSRAERISILEQLEQSLDHAVAAIAATVEMRDPYTAGHQRRVASLATAIAVEMGLPDDKIEGLRMASIIHDIGKVHVPAEILSNPGKLSEYEFAIVKTHPKTGWEILKSIDFPWPVAEIVYQHHEKLDGSGYPRGLKGDEILLEARILTVADIVEAMASHRPYRAGFGIFPALQEISRQKGIYLDLDVVKACLLLFLDKNYEL